MRSSRLTAAGKLSTVFIRYALQNQQAGASQTYVALADEEIIGYHALVVGQVEYNEAPERLRKGLARLPVPVMLLARLAVATIWQEKESAPGSLRTQWSGRFRQPISQASALLPFTRKTMKPGHSMNILIF